MKLGGSRVGEKLEGRVQRLSGPDDGNRENDPTPVSGGNVKEKCRGKDNQGSSSVNPCVMLAANHAQDADDRVTETANTAAKLKRSRFGAFHGCDFDYGLQGLDLVAVGAR